jgi:hypothetical protein
MGVIESIIFPSQIDKHSDVKGQVAPRQEF